MKEEQNRFMTTTGPGTPMGKFLRRYWLPVLLAAELPQNDCPPVRVTLLSERLIAFRDSMGRYGLIDEFCAHRGVSLWFGRNEDCGLRCPYHGWKYDVTGRCVDVPSEPASSGYAQKIKLKSYELLEKGGILWAYLGAAEDRPATPEFEWNWVPEGHCYISKRLQECNYLQAMEGGIDSSHVSFLHSGDLHNDPLHRSTKGAEYQRDRMPKFEIVESPGGLMVGARRQADPGNYYWRVTQWMMPFFSIVPPYGDNALNAHAWVPIDNESCFAWTMTYHPTRKLTAEELSVMQQGQGIHCELVPGTFRPTANRENDYLMDRAAQKAGRSYSGVKGIAIQDSAVQESMGAIQDRTRENLVSTDNAIIMARHRLYKAAVDLENRGISPPGLDPETQKVRSAAFVLPAEVPFSEAQAEVFRARPGIPHTSI